MRSKLFVVILVLLAFQGVLSLTFSKPAHQVQLLVEQKLMGLHPMHFQSSTYTQYSDGLISILGGIKTSPTLALSTNIKPLNFTVDACKNLTDEQKNNLNALVAIVLAKLVEVRDDLDAVPVDDSNYQTRINVKNQISYLETISNILNSNCTNSVIFSQTVFQTNIDAPNWITGNQTIQDVVNQYTQRSFDESNITNCPINTPFATPLGCIECYFPTDAFNIETGQCTSCPLRSQVDSQKRICVNSTVYYLTNLESDRWISSVPEDQLKQQYQQILDNQENATYCPQSQPFFDGWKCIDCLEPENLFDLDSSICTQCVEGQQLNVNNRDCQEIIAPTSNNISQNVTQNLTQPKTLKPNISNPLARSRIVDQFNRYDIPCPSKKPFYNGTDCIDCKEPAPLFNETSLKCTFCPNGTVHILETRECEKINGSALSGKQRTIGYNDSDNNLVRCKDEEPFFDGQSCIECEDLFDASSGNCTTCPQNTVFSTSSNICVPTKPNGKNAANPPNINPANNNTIGNNTPTNQTGGSPKNQTNNTKVGGVSPISNQTKPQNKTTPISPNATNQTNATNAKKITSPQPPVLIISANASAPDSFDRILNPPEEDEFGYDIPCSEQAPFFDGQSCIECEDLFDASSGNCTTCPQNTVFNGSSNTCQEIPEPPVLSISANASAPDSFDRILNPPEEDEFGYDIPCSDQAPFFNGQDCIECEDLFDASSGNCTTCPQNTVFSTSSNICVPTKPNGKNAANPPNINPANNNTIGNNTPTNQTGGSPKNQTNNTKVGGVSPISNQTKPQNKTTPISPNATNQTNATNATKITSPQPPVLIISANASAPDSFDRILNPPEEDEFGYDIPCSEQAPFFDGQSCIECEDLFDASSGNCTTCPQNTVFNGSSNTCQEIPEPPVLSISANASAPDSFDRILNPPEEDEFGYDIPCSDQAPFFNGQDCIECEDLFDASSGNCTTCPQNTVFSTSSNICVPTKPNGKNAANPPNINPANNNTIGNNTPTNQTGGSPKNQTNNTKVGGVSPISNQTKPQNKTTPISPNATNQTNATNAKKITSPQPPVLIISANASAPDSFDRILNPPEEDEFGYDIPCSEQAPFFDGQSCIECEDLFDASSGNCTTCPQNTVFNGSSNTCQEIPEPPVLSISANASAPDSFDRILNPPEEDEFGYDIPCSDQAPFFNGQDCIECEDLFDASSGNCTTCPQNTVFSTSSNICVPTKPNGKNAANPPNINPANNNTIGNNTPTNQTGGSPKNQTNNTKVGGVSPISNQTKPQNKTTPISPNATNQTNATNATKITSPQPPVLIISANASAPDSFDRILNPPEEDEFGYDIPCSEQAPFFDGQSCIECEDLFDASSGNCTTCPQNTVFNGSSNTCQEIPEPPVLSISANASAPDSFDRILNPPEEDEFGYDIPCSDQAPFFNGQDCIECEDLFDASSGNCTTCPQNTVFSTSSNICVPTKPNGKNAANPPNINPANNNTIGNNTPTNQTGGSPKNQTNNTKVGGVSPISNQTKPQNKTTPISPNATNQTNATNATKITSPQPPVLIISANASAPDSFDRILNPPEEDEFGYDIPCSEQAPFFDGQSCIECEDLFDASSGNCTTCPQNTVFNGSSNTCQEIPEPPVLSISANASAPDSFDRILNPPEEDEFGYDIPCSDQAPFFNGQDCIECEDLFDASSGNCTTCPQNTVFSTSSNICVPTKPNGKNAANPPNINPANNNTIGNNTPTNQTGGSPKNQTNNTKVGGVSPISNQTKPQNKTTPISPNATNQTNATNATKITSPQPPVLIISANASAPDSFDRILNPPEEDEFGYDIPCSEQAPFFDGQSCIECEDLFDASSGNCTTCPQNTVFNGSSNTCQEIPEPPVLSISANASAPDSFDRILNPPEEDEFGYDIPCSDQAPFFNGQDCIECEDLFDASSGNCTTCPQNTVFSTSSNICVPTKPNGKNAANPPNINPANNNTIGNNTPTNQTGGSPKNQTNNTKVGGVSPISNQTKPQNKTTPISPNATNQTNATNATKITSPQPPVLIISANASALDSFDRIFKFSNISSTSYDISCHDEAPFFNGHQCIQCQDFFNQSSLKCILCPSNTIFNLTVGYCQNITSDPNSTSPSGYDRVLTPQGYILNQNPSDIPCPSQTPFFDGSQCIICNAPNYLFDVTSLRCTSCPELYKFNQLTHQCDELNNDYLTRLSAPRLLNGGMPPAYWQKVHDNLIAANSSRTDCPASAPYYDGVKCLSCSHGDKNYFDLDSRQCQNCSGTFQYNNQTGDCIDTTQGNLSTNPSALKMSGSIFAHRLELLKSMNHASVRRNRYV